MNDAAGLAVAAMEASGVALEIRNAEGGVVYANALAQQALSSLAPSQEEILADGRTFKVERRGFSLAGRDYSVTTGFDIDAQRRLQDELFQRAYFDPLTGLPNRELCDRAISDLMRTSAPGDAFAVAVIDIDKFSQINAFHGSGVGDALLARMAERISQSLLPSDLLGRSGGDEFTVLLAQTPGAEARRRMEEIVKRISDPYFIDGAEIFAAATAGVSLWPRDDSTPDGLRHRAKSAIAEARRQVGESVRLFEPEIERAELARATVENGLRSAIRDRRVGCAFQPKFDFRAGVVDSLEVLMRWRDDEGRWNSPSEFLDLAHKTGLTNELTRLVFEETLASLDAIGATFGPGLDLGFNISARQAGDAHFMREFSRKLGDSGHARRFVIELTEEAFLPATQFQSRVLPMLREIGAKIAIDDFGAGFSSLSTLAEITADEVKVDRSLISSIDQRPRNQSLLRAIESIGSALGTEVMVEGVETAEELAYLVDFTQIRVAQGYYFGRPQTLSDGARIDPEALVLRQRAAAARERSSSLTRELAARGA